MDWPIWRVAVAERSMEPALRPGDWLLVWRLGGRGQAPRGHASHGQAPGGQAPGGQALRYRRRLRPGQLVVARNPQQPDMLLVKRLAWAQGDGWWLDSDNPGAGAIDSARFGVVGPDLIEGLVLLRYGRARRSPD